MGCEVLVRFVGAWVDLGRLLTEAECRAYRAWEFRSKSL